MKENVLNTPELPKDINNKVSRLEVRVTNALKSRFKMAAKIKGISLSDFVKTYLHEVANRIIMEEYTILNSDRDKKLFYEALMNPPNPSRNLVQRAKRFKNAAKQ